MASRPCLDCGRVSRASRCSQHSAARELMRRANYDSRHRAMRAALAATLPAPCWYCGQPVTPAHTWVAAHERDGDPESPRHAAHAGCNERAKAR